MMRSALRMAASSSATRIRAEAALNSRAPRSPARCSWPERPGEGVEWQVPDLYFQRYHVLRPGGGAQVEGIHQMHGDVLAERDGGAHGNRHHPAAERGAERKLHVGMDGKRGAQLHHVAL